MESGLGQVERSIAVHLADDAALVSIGRRMAVFSGKRQRLFELNETAVWLARRLEAGTRWPALRDVLADHGLAPVIAGTYARDSVLMWSREGIAAATLAAAPGWEAARQTIEIAGLRRTLCYGTRAPMERIAPVFAHLEAGEQNVCRVSIDPASYQGAEMLTHHALEMLKRCTGLTKAR